jgi:thioredoxin 2
MEQPNSEVVRCPRCGAKNRVPLYGAALKPKCGKCGSPLEQRAEKDEKPFLLRCMECGAKNKVPPGKIDRGPVCGKCKKPLRTEELFAPQPLMITEGGFEKYVLQSPLPVLVFAWAPWCTTCRAFMPVIDEFAREVKGRIRVAKLNVDQTPNLASTYAIMSVPQIFVFDGGKLIESFPGALQKNEIRTKFARYL